MEREGRNEGRRKEIKFSSFNLFVLVEGFLGNKNSNPKKGKKETGTPFCVLLPLSCSSSDDGSNHHRGPRNESAG